MLDKDKLYIVVYIGIKDIDDSDVPAYINEITTHITSDFDDSVKFLIIPTRHKDTHIEFVNSGELLKRIEPEEAKSLIEKLQKMIEN